MDEQPQLKWQKDSSGNLVMPVHQSEFLDWLLTPKPQRDPESQAAWARKYNYTQETVRTWKRDPRFKEEYRRRADEKVVSTERIQAMLDSLFTRAENGDVQAAVKYLDYAAKLLPPKQVQDEEFKGLTDEDLVEQIKAELFG